MVQTDDWYTTRLKMRIISNNLASLFSLTFYKQYQTCLHTLHFLVLEEKLLHLKNIKWKCEN